MLGRNGHFRGLGVGGAGATRRAAPGHAIAIETCNANQKLLNFPANQCSKIARANPKISQLTRNEAFDEQLKRFLPGLQILVTTE